MLDKEIINGFIVHDRRITNYIYDQYLPVIKKLVLANQGTEDEAQDIFQDALLIIYRKIKFYGLKLKCKFSTYLYSICKNLWLQELEKRDKGNLGYYDHSDLNEEIGFNDELEKKKSGLYLRHFQKLGEECRRLLHLFFDRIPFIEIMRIMGYPSRQYAIDKKYRCQRQLINSLTGDPEYEELLDEIFETHR